MSVLKILQHLSTAALILEVLHRGVIALINAIRLLFSAEYRAEVFGRQDEHTVVAG